MDTHLALRPDDEASAIDEAQKLIASDGPGNGKENKSQKRWRRKCLMQGTAEGGAELSEQPADPKRKIPSGRGRDESVPGRPQRDSFSDLFHTFSPQLVAFFRARGCERALAEDLAQEVMLIVYRKATQIRDRSLFRAWLFKIARNALCRHYGKQAQEVETVDLADGTDRLIAAGEKPHRNTGFRVPPLDGLFGFAGTRSHDPALHRAVGIPRDRRCPGHPHRDRAVEGV